MKSHVAAAVLLMGSCLHFGLAQTGTPVSAQRGVPQLPTEAAQPVPSGGAPSVQLPPMFSGGVPSGQAVPGVMDLSLFDAINRGLKQNLGAVLGEQGTRLATAARFRARSALLPTITAATSETSQQVNLEALGFRGFPGAPGFKTIIGPFSVFDARAYVSQQVLNLSAIRGFRAGNEAERAAQFSFRDARDIVVLAVANLYLVSTAGAARIDAAQAQVNTAQALYNRTVDLKSAGMVAGIEVLRAQVELQAQQQRLIFFQNEFEKQKLTLAQAIGLPLGQQFRLSTQIPYTPPPPLTLETALDQAYQHRSDFRSAQAQLRAAEFTRGAAEAERLPTLGFNGNYGTIGPSLLNSHGTFAAAIGLNIPIFQAGRVRADVLQADAQLQQQRAVLENLRAQIDYEVRKSMLDLKAAGDQVQVASSAVKLAGEQLTQANDRFTAGVANNLEVVQAQEAVATANENYISSLYLYNAAKAELARALGLAEEGAKRFLGGTQ